MFITFKSQAPRSRFTKSDAVHGILNQAARDTSWGRDIPHDIWQQICQFAVKMNGSCESKTGWLFYNTTLTDVSVDWIKDHVVD